MRFALAAAIALVWAAFGHQPQPADAAPIPVRVVVVTTFELGNDSGDLPGEFQHWVERYPLPTTLPFAQGYRKLRYNAAQHVLGIVTGEGKSHAAASIMALGMDPRFDLRKAYWILAGIAGVDPACASIGSAAWARYVVDGDLAYEIDDREIPATWPTGIVPFDRSTPYQEPVPPDASLNGDHVFALNAGLVNWAYALTRDVRLPDDRRLASTRAGYPNYPQAQRRPFVLRGDTLTGDRFFIGRRTTNWAERWVAYWTHGKGTFAMSAEEDTGYLQSLKFLAHAGRIDFRRVTDLRTASDFTSQPIGTSAAQLLARDAQGKFPAYLESLDAAYMVGSRFVREIASHWARYADHIPSAH